jgi:tripartite-type tricarboxylate transporter receptor subunit TctC
VLTVLVVNPKGPFLTLQDLLAFAHANPERITYASPGAGTFPQLITEMLRATAGIRLAHVPYKGMVLAIADLLAGRVDMAIDAVGNSLSHIRDGKLKALAIASEARIAQLPNVPTISETYPGFLSTSGWIAVVAPPLTPPAVAAELSQAIVETLALPQVAKRLCDLSVTPVGISPIETAIFVKQERERWGKIVESIGVKLD